MKQHKVNPKSIQNLCPVQSADGAKDLDFHLAVRISKAMIAELDNLPGDRSSKVRTALADYLRNADVNRT